ncbi:hypothetical protein PICSAR71_00229 [Mycobacterium avium subsp. paratuberculosis]|nr:hypothetical protein PICSAR71_00229 [Mycobacterium avium subsp. paratuberculosis]
MPIAATEPIPAALKIGFAPSFCIRLTESAVSLPALASRPCAASAAIIASIWSRCERASIACAAAVRLLSSPYFTVASASRR